MFKSTIEKYYPEMAAIREDLHRHPELSFKEFRTSALIVEKLKEYGVDEVTQPCETGVVGLIKGGLGEGKCLAIRADIDALPIVEESGVAFASENPGVMHACGHDLHTSTLLLVARVLCENRDKFKGSVKLIFQQAEEAANPADPRGGSVHMVEAGCMENPHVDAIIALHVSPDLERHGSFGIKRGVCTSGFDLYRFDVHGKTSHGSQPHKGNDAILALAELIVALQQIISRNLDPMKDAIITVGTMKGGSAVNIIPDEATAGGCFRYYDNGSAEVIRRRTLEIAKGIESISNCKIDVDVKRGYACVDNDDALIDFIDKTLVETMGEESRFYQDEPASGSEDFSYYNVATGTPCALLWLSTNPMTDKVYPLHSSKCCMKSDIIKIGAEAFTNIAVKYLNA